MTPLPTFTQMSTPRSNRVLVMAVEGRKMGRNKTGEEEEEGETKKQE